MDFGLVDKLEDLIKDEVRIYYRRLDLIFDVKANLTLSQLEQTSSLQTDKPEKGDAQRELGIIRHVNDILQKVWGFMALGVHEQ